MLRAFAAVPHNGHSTLLSSMKPFGLITADFVALQAKRGGARGFMGDSSVALGTSTSTLAINGDERDDS